MVNRVNAWQLLALLPLLAACTPAFDDRSSAVDGPRVLALRSLPAEAAPGEALQYQLLVVDQAGTVRSPRATWSYCTQPKPTNELNDVASACFQNADVVTAFGTGTAPTGKLPANACAQFGPDVPRPVGNSNSDSSGNTIKQTQGRPTDPDLTGGYFQPLILDVFAGQTRIPTLGETRITCNLAGSTLEQLADYKLRTTANENPQLSGVTVASLGDADLSAEDAAEPTEFAASQTYTLRASWPACPTTPACGDGICSPSETKLACPDDCTTPKGCGGSEPFGYLDPQAHAVVDRHESMRVSWFATAGRFDADHTGRLEAEFSQTSSDNAWTAPAEAGPVFMWVTLRDDRGGVDWRSFKVDVR